MIHLKKRILARNEDAASPKIRLAFLHSDGKRNTGQLWDSGATLQHHLLPPEFRVSEEQDVTTGDIVEWMEPYDALGATLCQDPTVCVLVKSYSCWDELYRELVSDTIALEYVTFCFVLFV
jgi:hypothetical protein